MAHDERPPSPFKTFSRRDLVARIVPAVATVGLFLALPPRRLLGEDGDLDETPTDDEGPFYREGAPDRSDLKRKDSPSAPITISGLVRAEDGKILPGVTFDVWHADSGGAYDNESPAFRFRGKFKTDAKGRYSFETNYPGRYGDASGRMRPRHIHVKCSGTGLWGLTTQMYFEVRANVDVTEELVVPITWTGDGKKRTGTGTWSVVLARQT